MTTTTEAGINGNRKDEVKGSVLEEVFRVFSHDLEIGEDFSNRLNQHEKKKHSTLSQENILLL